MHTPTLRQLQFLVAIAETGSFSRAAEVCHVTQPTLSAAIKEVEALLGTQLLERHARGIELTKAGEIAAERARGVLASAQDLVAATQQISQPLSGIFRLGAIPTIGPFLFPRALPKIRKRYPENQLLLREDTTDRLLDALKNRSLDAAIIAQPWATPGIETLPLLDDEFRLVAPVDHPLLKNEKLTPTDLLDSHMLLLEEGHCLRDHAQKICNMPAKRERDDVTATSLLTLIYMVESGLGVSMLPKLAIDAGLANGVNVACVPFSPPMMGRSIGLAWRAGSPREDEVRLLGEVIGELYKSV